MSDVSGQRLVDGVVEASGERLAVLTAGDGDGGWSWRVGWYVRLPGVVALVGCQWLAVHAGCFQGGRCGGVGSCRLAGPALPVQAPLVEAVLPADGGDPAVCKDGLRVWLVPVVGAHGCFAGLPCPDVALPVGDDGLVLVCRDPACFHALRRADGCRVGCAVGQVPGLPVRVQEEEPLVEGLCLDGARAGVLPDGFGLDIAGAARLPGPGLPVRVHDEGPAGGGGGGDGLRLPGQDGRGLLQEFRIRVPAVFLAVLEGVDLSFTVHGQEPVSVQADAGEPGVLSGVEDGGR